MYIFFIKYKQTEKNIEHCQRLHYYTSHTTDKNFFVFQKEIHKYLIILTNILKY